MAYYLIGDDKSLEEGYVKSEVDSTVNRLNQSIENNSSTLSSLRAQVSQMQNNLSAKQNKITSGTAAPSGGSNGDIYIQY